MAFIYFFLFSNSQFWSRADKVRSQDLNLWCWDSHHYWDSACQEVVHRISFALGQVSTSCSLTVGCIVEWSGMIVIVHGTMVVSAWAVPVKWDIGNYERKVKNDLLRTFADILGYFNCASPRSTFNHVSLFFIAIHRTLPLSPIFRKFCNKFYPVFHICIYSDLLKSLSLWVTNRKEEGKRLGISSSKPVVLFFFKTQKTIYFFICLTCLKH